MSDNQYIQELANIKNKSEQFWQNVKLDICWGYQIQPASIWRQGLTEEQIDSFEQALGLTFPAPLRLFYRTMNGLNKPGINIQGDSGEDFTYRSVLYSYPDDLDLIKNNIDWIYEANRMDVDKLKVMGASRIFPIYSHRFMLIDEPGCPILSMYGDDIIYWCKDIVELLKIDVLHQSRSYEERVKDPVSQHIKFWLD